METIEYTRQRFVLTDKSPLNGMLAVTFFGAGLILIGFSFKKPEYLPFGLFLIAASGLLFFFSRESTYATFDRESRLMEIVRKPIIGKIRVEKYKWEEIQDVRTTEKDPESERLKYRLELRIEDKGWVPLTKPYQTDAVAFETLPGKILGFIQEGA